MSSQQRNSAQQRGRAATGDGKFRRTTSGEEEDFSIAVRDRLATYTRTGQACDRCKIRKIRCDAGAEGCTTCRNIGHPCKVTDRTTGDTHVRGFTRELQRQIEGKDARIRDLEALLLKKGVKVKPEEAKTSPQSDNQEWTKYASLEIQDSSGHVNQPGLVSVVGAMPRNHLAPRSEITTWGVGDDSSPLSSVKGTKLVIMGTEIDTANFTAPDLDEVHHTGDIYNKSVVAFTRSATRENTEMKIDLPDRAMALAYSEWYMNIMHSYVPVLHPPSFWKMFYRIYDQQNYQPTVIELVHLHMVLAIIYYQYGTRMRQDPEQHHQLNDLSNRHYHYCVHKTYDLMISPDVGAVQALTLMAVHTRAFPKPGCGAFISSLAFQRALELGLHRAPKEPESGSNLAIEMRKRTWWTLLTIYVSVTGRRGRPMPIAVTDFDVPFPEHVHDDCITENGIDYNPKEPKPCNWDVGMATFKLLPILMEMYAHLYSVRPDADNYLNIVKTLEAQAQRWEEELPEGLKMNATEDEPNDVATLYMQQFYLELRLWLRHNSVNPSRDKNLLAENTRLCDETARKLLRVVQQVIRLQCLDTTWTQMAVYAMCLFSMLVTGYERRFQMTPDKLDILRGEMDEWLAVIAELSEMIGCGSEIRDRIALIVESTISWIIQDMERERARAASARLKIEEPAIVDSTIGQVPPAQAVAQPPEPVAPEPSTHSLSQPYYHPPATGEQSQYPVAYSGQARMTRPYQDTATYYSTTPQHPAPIPPSSGVQTQGIVDYPQAANHLDSPNQYFWQRPQENAWNTWTTAVSESQERFRTDLIAANPPVAATTGHRPSVGTLPTGPPAPQEVTAQWPLIMFDAAHHQAQLHPGQPLHYTAQPQHAQTQYRSQVPHSLPTYTGGPL